MSGQTTVGWKEFPCPECGYDLRARTSARCPECGAEVKDIVRSHIPWEHRKQLGSVRAFARTAWWACLKPRKLTGGVLERVSGPAARRFHRISLWLASLMTMAIVFVGFEWTHGFDRSDVTMGVPQESTAAIRDYLFPAAALANTWWALLPLFVSCHLCVTLASWLFRSMVVFVSGNPRHQRKVARIAQYATALAFAEVLVLGPLFLFFAAADANKIPSSAMMDVVLAVVGLVGILMVTALFAVCAGKWIWATGGRRVTRLLMMLVAYPLCMAIMVPAITVLVFWILGYTAIALNSMLSR